MHVDRKTFLALATSIAALTACASEDNVGAGADNFTEAERPPGSQKAGDDRVQCINPTTEGTSEEQQTIAKKVLTFNPVGNFPAAEAFCSLVGRIPGEFTDNRVSQKCLAYQTQFVPWVTLVAFQTMKSKIVVDPRGEEMPLAERLQVLLEIDRKIAADRSFCTTDAAKKACSALDAKVRASCEQVATQVNPSRQDAFARCLGLGSSLHSCIEGIDGLTFERLGE